MNAEQMFSISRKSRDFGCAAGLSNRICLALRRVSCEEHNYIDKETLEAQPEIIRRDVLNGRIWGHRNIGEKTVRDICEWLSELPEQVASDD